LIDLSLKKNSVNKKTIEYEALHHTKQGVSFVIYILKTNLIADI